MVVAKRLSDDVWHVATPVSRSGGAVVQTEDEQEAEQGSPQYVRKAVLDRIARDSTQELCGDCNWY